MKTFFFIAHVIYQVQIITRIIGIIPHYLFVIPQTVTLIQNTNNHKISDENYCKLQHYICFF